MAPDIIHLEGHALRWHHTFMHHSSFAEVRWDDYFKQMEDKFTDEHEHHLIALKKLQQGDGLVANYEW